AGLAGAIGGATERLCVVHSIIDDLARPLTDASCPVCMLGGAGAGASMPSMPGGASGPAPRPLGGSVGALGGARVPAAPSTPQQDHEPSCAADPQATTTPQGWRRAGATAEERPCEAPKQEESKPQGFRSH